MRLLCDYYDITMLFKVLHNSIIKSLQQWWRKLPLPYAHCLLYFVCGFCGFSGYCGFQKPQKPQ